MTPLLVPRSAAFLWETGKRSGPVKQRPHHNRTSPYSCISFRPPNRSHRSAPSQSSSRFFTSSGRTERSSSSFFLLFFLLPERLDFRFFICGYVRTEFLLLRRAALFIVEKQPHLHLFSEHIGVYDDTRTIRRAHPFAVVRQTGLQCAVGSFSYFRQHMSLPQIPEILAGIEG